MQSNKHNIIVFFDVLEVVDWACLLGITEFYIFHPVHYNSVNYSSSQQIHVVVLVL